MACGYGIVTGQMYCSAYLNFCSGRVLKGVVLEGLGLGIIGLYHNILACLQWTRNIVNNVKIENRKCAINCEFNVVSGSAEDDFRQR